MAEETQSTAAKNTVTIEKAGPCKKKVSIEIPRESITSVTDEQYKSLQAEALVPGFRKGRAPRRLLEKRFGKETTEQIKLKLIAEATESAVKDNELEILGEPDVDLEKIEMPAEGPLKFDFEVEVQPEFELPKLEGIPLNKTKVEITEEQVDREIEQLQKYSGIWTPRKDEAVQLEDQIIADVLLKAEKAEDAEDTEEAEEGEKLDNIDIYVRPTGFVAAVPVENLGKLLTGAKAGETKETTVEVPKTYFNEQYRGKKVDIKITIKDIKWLKPAELDENLFARLGIKDEDELRERIRETLNNRLESQSRTKMTEQIYQYLLKNTEFDLPLDIVGRQANTMLQRQYISLMQQGLSREQIDEHMDHMRASSEGQAKEQLKTFFIMDKIAEKFEIKVSDEELNGHIAQLAIQQGRRPEKMREQMERDGSLSQFRLDVQQSQCITKLLETAKITEVKPKKKAEKAKKSAKKTAVDKEKPSKKSKSTAKKKT